MLLAGCGGARPEPEPTPAPPRGDGRLAIGISEENPAFLAGSRDPVFDRWRLSAIRPTYFRLVIDWGKYTAEDGTFDPARPQSGCVRAVGPCAPYLGLRAQLRALARAQRADPGRYRVMAVLYSTPSQHASAPDRCSPDAEPRSRPPRDLDAYRAALRAIEAEADRAGVEIEFWAPWNEPNGSYFLATCDPPGEYLRLVDAAREVLGDDRLVLGELAGFSPEVFRALPEELVCGAAAFGVHDYAGGADPLPPLERALDRLDCPDPPPIWVTETGSQAQDFTRAQACRADRANLARWYADPRVAAAFHFEFREDNLFRTGLIDIKLDHAFPVLGVWRAWGTRDDPAQRPPAVPCKSR